MPCGHSGHHHVVETSQHRLRAFVRVALHHVLLFPVLTGEPSRPDRPIAAKGREVAAYIRDTKCRCSFECAANCSVVFSKLRALEIFKTMLLGG